MSALREQLEQSQLDYVNEKAQIATLARLAGGASAAQRPPVSPAPLASRGLGPASSQWRPPDDPWQTIPTVCSEVRAGRCERNVAVSEQHRFGFGCSAPHDAWYSSATCSSLSGDGSVTTLATPAVLASSAGPARPLSRKS